MPTTQMSGQRSDRTGDRLRELRRVYGFSQRQLARLCGVTNGTISMIEQGRISPSVASLKKILDAFGMSLGQFFSDDWQPETSFFFRSTELKQLADGALLSLRQVGQSLSHRKMQVLHERYAPGGDTGESMLTHDGEEAGVVVRGRVEITVGGMTETLGPGDAYYFDSRLPHRFRNCSDEDCEIVSACTPPSF